MLETSSNFRALLDLIGPIGVIRRGAGSPDGSEVGDIGDIYARTDGGPGNAVYLKVADPGLNTGWVPVGPSLEDDLTSQLDGTATTFTLSSGAKAFHNPAYQIVLEVYLDGQRLIRGGSADYTVAESGGPSTGFDTISFNFTPRADSKLIVLYLPL